MTNHGTGESRSLQAPVRAGSDRSDSPNAAPGELELVREFVNTFDAETGSDSISTVDGLVAWLADRDLTPPSVRASAVDVGRVAAVREALRELLLANNSGEPPAPGAIAELNRQSEEAEVGLLFSEEGSALETRCGGVDAGIAGLLAIVHEAMREGSWSRLKACPADDCLWAFYDHSRNRSGTWCDMAECGNRAKARAYRERHRSEAPR